MNLLCPNCQKMLTVPEQFAGQLMKCPLCSGTFTVPALPAGSDPAVPSPPPEPTPEPAAAFTPPPLPSSPPPEPAFASGPIEPAFSTAAAPKQVEPKPTASTPPPSAPSVHSVADGYHRTVRVAANVSVLRWVPLACFVLIFFLQFFPWVGVYPGGVPAVTQSAWGAAFGGYSPDSDMKKEFSIVSAVDAADNKEVSNEPGFGPLTFFYLIPFFLVTLAFTIFVAAQPFLTFPLPPQLTQMLPYKWAILAGLNVVLLVFLTMQLLLNFSLENSVKNWIEKLPEVTKLKDNKHPTTQEVKQLDAFVGKYLMMLRRTIYLRLAFFLHILSTLAAGLVYWVERRGTSKPVPTIELKW